MNYKSACEKYNENTLNIKQKFRPNHNNDLGLFLRLCRLILPEMWDRGRGW